MKLGRPSLGLMVALALAWLVAGCCVCEIMYNLAGTVVDQDGTGIPGVTISFGGGFGTAVTDEDGNWHKLRLYGKITVIPAKDGFSFEPEKQVVDHNTYGNVNFIGIPKPLDLTLHSVLVTEIREDRCLPKGCGCDTRYSYDIHGIVTNAGGPADYKIDILGMAYGTSDGPWFYITTYGPQPIEPGSADIVISTPASKQRYGWLRFEVYGYVGSDRVLSDEVTEEVV